MPMSPGGLNVIEVVRAMRTVWRLASQVKTHSRDAGQQPPGSAEAPSNAAKTTER